MQFNSLPVLQHAHACLRLIEPADLPVWAAYLRLPQVYQHTSWNLQAVSELEPHLASRQVHQPDSPLRLAIACPHSHVLLGTIGFHTASALNKSAELAYDLAPEAWGRGIASAAAMTMTDWAHAEAGIIRVQATVLESNERSMAVLQRCGFVREGVLASYRQVRGQSGNFVMYSHVLQSA